MLSLSSAFNLTVALEFSLKCFTPVPQIGIMSDSKLERLNKAPEPFVRSILISLCKKGQVMDKAIKLLGRFESHKNESPTAETDAKREPRGRRRARPTRPKFASSVGRRFVNLIITPTPVNTITVSWSPAPWKILLYITDTCLGNLKPDEENDAFQEYEEDAMGPYDSDEMRENYPQGFLWDCCKADGTTKGCKREKHEAKDGKRGRYC
jgi:hypothetical protein